MTKDRRAQHAVIVAYLRLAHERDPLSIAGLVRLDKRHLTASEICDTHPEATTPAQIDATLSKLRPEYPWVFYDPEKRAAAIKSKTQTPSK